MLEFNEELHEYRYNGEIVQSVTQILKPISGYDGIPEWKLEQAAERGRKVHLATELYDGDDLDMDSISPDILPYVEAWIRFRQSTDYEVVLMETQVYSEKYGYAGTLDRLLQKKNDYYLADIKSTYDHQPTVGPQTAAYQQALEEQLGIKIKGRLSLRVKRDGKSEVVPLKSRNDLPIFLNCLKIAKWRTDHYGK